MGNKVFALKIHGPREYSFSESEQVHSSLDAGVGGVADREQYQYTESVVCVPA